MTGPPVAVVLDPATLRHLAAAIAVYGRVRRTRGHRLPAGLVDLLDTLTRWPDTAGHPGDSTPPNPEAEPGQPHRVGRSGLLTPQDAARYLRVSERTVRRRAASGHLTPVHHYDGRVYYRREDLDQMMEQPERNGVSADAGPR